LPRDVLDNDIRQGADFVAFQKGNFVSANQHLRAEWAFWRKTAPKYRFGRTEVLPVKSNAEAISAYVGKYISKHVQQRAERDKGYKLVLCSKGARKANCRFAWHSVKAWLWRAKLGVTAKQLGFSDLNQFQEKFGNSWAYHLGEMISKAEVQEYPTLEHALADEQDVELVPADAVKFHLAPRPIQKIYTLVKQVASDNSSANSSQD
jgi:hypothetical protein